MGVPLNGYRTARLLRSSGQSHVYEAIREADGKAVIAKVFDLESDDVEPRVEHEFTLIKALDLDGVVNALSLERVGDQLILLLERVPGQNLAEYTQHQPLDLDRFFSIAIQLSDVIARIHDRRVIHRDIKPTNILIDPDTGQVCLADFGISVLLDAERRHLYDPAVLEGTLPYISPEQTGRTGRSVDFRSDLYSLGVTLYELLTGQRPFDFAAPLDLIHAHLARNPTPPVALRSELPDGVSRLVLKLLEKAPEHRYQTASGLAVDLRKLRELVELGMDGHGLELGREDFPAKLQLPHQVYGRMQERHELVDELDRVMRSHTSRVMLLTGPPGIGKSMLLADFEGPVSGFGGYLARGKFDVYRELPYSGFVAAFETLVEQLLTESEDRLEQWSLRISEALGNLGQVMVELIPSLELVIGRQQPIVELELHEARNRLHLAVARFLSSLCDGEQPLVVVLDDLHRADRSSLELLRSLVEGARRGALLILGSYREQDLDPEHPLNELIDSLAEHHRLRITRLRPLSEQAVESLLADTLGRPAAEVSRLAQIIGRKTDNNPLFIRQFLSHLDERGLLQPSPSGWTWDEARVEAAGIPDDVLAVMRAKLVGLSEDSRELLARAACVGPRFDLASLEIVTGHPRSQLAPTLYTLVATGLLAAIGREYSFAHDRIQDAAYAGLEASQRQRLHWLLGRDALERATPLADEQLFEVVDHLDAGLVRSLEVHTGPLDDSARFELAQLNLRAGSRALGSAAYEAALRYLEVGAALLPNERASVAKLGEAAPHYRLVIDVLFARAQALAMLSRNEAAGLAFGELLEWQLDIGSYGRVAARRVRLLTLEDKRSEAVRFGVDALVKCGYTVPHNPSTARMFFSLVRGWRAVRRYDTDALLALPECTDPRVSAAMELITAIKHVAYVVDAKLLMLLTGLHVRLFLRHGIHPTCAHALSQLAIGIGPGLGRVEDAIVLCEQGLALAARAPDTNSMVLVEAAAYLFVWHLGRPFSEPLARLDEAYERALESGDFEYAGYMGALGLSMHFEVGTHLRVVERLTRRLERDLGRWGSLEMVLVAWMIRSFAVTLIGKASEDDEVIEDEIDGQTSDVRDALDARVLTQRGSSRVSIYAANINMSLLRVIFNDCSAALEGLVEVMRDIEEVMLGSWMVPRAALSTVLAGVGCIETHGSVAPPVSAAIRSSLRLLRRWAKNCPANFACYYDLARGAHDGMRQQPDRAMRRLEHARAEASKRGNRMIEGMAAEKLAEIAAREGLLAFAGGARQQAWAAYEAWGATAKLRQLRNNWPGQFGHLGREEPLEPTKSRQRSAKPRRPFQLDHPEPAAARSGTNTNTEFLDFESVLQAVGSMNEELGLEQVIERVLDAAITNAGGDRGVLLLERGGVMGIVAEASITGDHTSYATPVPLTAAGSSCPISLVHFVLRTQQDLVIEDARTDPRFSGDTYIVRTGVQSLLGMPILKGKRLLGALVLENRLSAYCFTPERLEALGLITSQAASALDNANLYQALRRSEARWRSLVDGAPDLIILLNERGEIEFVNRNPIITVSPDELDGRLLERFLSAESAERWREATAAVLREGVQRELEVEALPEDDSPRWFVARLAPIEADMDGGARHAVAIATDVTERKIAEREREALETQLRQQQRLESIGTLASGVAHEINNPVQGILNYAELIVDNLDSHDTIREFAGEITTESNRVATIVRNLMQFARQEREQKVESVDIGALIEATLSLIIAVMRRDQIQVSTTISEDLPEVSCRLQQVQQVLMNLVANARDALNEVYSSYNERKRIEIRAETLTKAGEQWVRISVSDFGPGIPPDVLSQIFDPFFTTKGRDQGTGLGLAVSHGIAQDHGGELSVETTLGEGTCFRLDLPVKAS